MWLLGCNALRPDILLAGPPVRRRGGRLILPELAAHYRLFSPERITRALNTLNLVQAIFAFERAHPSQGRQTDSIPNRALAYDGVVWCVQKPRITPERTRGFRQARRETENGARPAEGRSCWRSSPKAMRKVETAFPCSWRAIEVPHTPNSSTHLRGRPSSRTSIRFRRGVGWIPPRQDGRFS